MAAAQPESIGPYRILRELGRGGQGVVYLAEDPRLRRKVAVKVLTGVGASCREGLDRFEREAEAASRLDHPGICTVYDVGRSEGQAWIAMRYVEGESLHQRIRSEGVGSSGTTFHLDGTDGDIAVDDEPVSSVPATRAGIIDVVVIVEKVARALHAAHEAGIVHRDIKPGNIMVGTDGQPVLMDFGLAHLEDPDLPALTQSGDLFGTPAYMSPEQLTLPLDRLDRRTDVWSLGVTLFECLTVRRPFEAATRQALFQEICDRDPPDPRELNPTVPRELRWVLEAALEKDPDRRYQTALDLAEDLRRVRRLEPIRARPVTWRIRLGRWGQRNPALAASLGSIFMLILVALGVSLFLLGEREAALSEKTSALDRYEQMSDAALVADLEARAARLWPRRPQLVLEMDEWLREAAEVVRRLPDHEAALQELRAGAAPYDAAQQEADRLRRRELHSAHYDAIVVARRAVWDAEEESASLLEEMETLAERIAARPADVLERRYEEMRARQTELTRELEERQAALRGLEADPRSKDRLTWQLGDPAERWRQQVLADLVREIASLESLIEDVRARRDFARTIADRSIAAHRAAWGRCLAEIATSPHYAASETLRRLRPVVGLVPLGVDRDSGLWEFWHLDSGERPEWEGAPGADDPDADPRGKVLIDDASGIVLVLVPGGSFIMGATREPEMLHHDPKALGVESPVREVTLEPFLIAKHELTQAQWVRLFGGNPSTYHQGGSNYLGDAITGLHPVTNVGWEDAREATWRWDLDLPTEAQWEYACRAGTGTVYWCGDSVSSIEGARAGNVADRTASQATPQWSCTQEVDDGHLVHSPVGCFAPNAFGLHDVLGNVMEWCRDRFTPYSESPRPGDGLRDNPEDTRRVYRGGSFYRDVSGARSATRNGNDATIRYGDLGLRPARALTR